METATMRAAVLYAPGDLRVEDAPVPVCGPGDVLVRVKAAGVCGSDLDRVMTTGTYSFPTIPGHEFCGVVEKTGAGVSRFSVGDRVVVAPILPCFACEFCQRGQYGQCDDYNYLGSRTNGGFAEYVAAPERNLVPLPDNVSFSYGAMVEPAAVTLHGMMRIGINAGDAVAVLGCGALGLFAVQFAKILGATRIIAVDVAEDKLAIARRVGATETINAKDVDPVRAILEKGPVDVAAETAGTPTTQVQAIETARKHGRVLCLGTAHGDVAIPPKVFEHIVRNEVTLTGAWNSFSAPFPGREWRAVVDYLENGSLLMEPLLSHTASLEELPERIRGMKDRKFAYAKVIVAM